MCTSNAIFLLLFVISRAHYVQSCLEYYCHYVIFILLSLGSKYVRLFSVYLRTFIILVFLIFDDLNLNLNLNLNDCAYVLEWYREGAREHGCMGTR